MLVVAGLILGQVKVVENLSLHTKQFRVRARSAQV